MKFTFLSNYPTEIKIVFSQCGSEAPPHNLYWSDKRKHHAFGMNPSETSVLSERMSSDIIELSIRYVCGLSASGGESESMGA